MFTTDFLPYLMADARLCPASKFVRILLSPSKPPSIAAVDDSSAHSCHFLRTPEPNRQLLMTACSEVVYG